MNSLPKTVTQHCHGCDLNPGPSAPESSTLSTWLTSHPVTVGVIKSHRIPWEYHRTGKDDCGKIFKVRSLGLISRGKYPNFWRYPKFLITQCGIDARKPKTSRFVQSFQYNPGL